MEEASVAVRRLFFPPGPIEAAWRRAGVGGEAEALSGLRSALGTAHLRSLALVAALAALPILGAQLGAPIVPSDTFVVALAMAIAVSADLAAEWRARKGGGALLAIRPLHRVWSVEPALRTLDAAGIEGFARTRHYRSLFHFFAPYAPIEILVSPERAEEADAIVGRVTVAAPV